MTGRLGGGGGGVQDVQYESEYMCNERCKCLRYFLDCNPQCVQAWTSGPIPHPGPIPGNHGNKTVYRVLQHRTVYEVIEKRLTARRHFGC